MQSVVGRVKTGNDGELLNCKYGLLVVSMMYHLSFYMHILGSAGWQGCLLSTAVKVSVR